MASSVIAQARFSVIQHGHVVSGEWTTRAAAVRMYDSQVRYATAIGQSTDGLIVVQGGYDNDDGERLTRQVHPKRTQWRLL